MGIKKLDQTMESVLFTLRTRKEGPGEEWVFVEQIIRTEPDFAFSALSVFEPVREYVEKKPPRFTS